MRLFRFLMISLFSFFGGIYLLYFCYIYFNQSELVFVNSKLPSDYEFNYQDDFDEVYIESYDGVKLNGLLFKSINSKGLVFFLHGNAGNLSGWGSISKTYTSLGYDVFILDYRGYGKSEGVIENEAQVMNDANLVFKKISKSYQNKKIFITGYSIGTGIATQLAAQNKIDALFLIAPFYNFSEFTKSRVLYFPDSFKKFKFETNKYITTLKAPIYIFHGDKDNIILLENAIRLKKIIKREDLLFTLVDEDHIGITDNLDFQRELKALLK